MKKIIVLALLVFSIVCNAQQLKTTPLHYKKIVLNFLQDTSVNISVLNQTFDGTNYWIMGGNALGIDTVLKRTWKIFDSLKQPITKQDKLSIKTAIEKEGSKKTELQPGMIAVELFGQEHQNLLASNIAVNGSSSQEEIDEMIKRRIALIKQNTPQEKQTLYQFSQPYYFNRSKNGLLFFLLVQPGYYNFYTTTVNLQNGGWANAKTFYLFSQKN